jgi:hypothetical protein
MKTQRSKIAKLALGLATIAVAAAALWLTPRAHAGTSPAPGQSSASGKPSHGGGFHGGGSGGGSGGSSFYATASTLSQLIADINYANSNGGAITINLAPGTTFDLTSTNNTTDGGNGLPVIGGTKAVALTIIGNGDTIERIAVISRFGTVKNPFRLFDVAAGSSLTLDHVTLRGGQASGPGGAILNQGTVNVINGSTLSGNTGTYGGGIYNAGGIVTISVNSVIGGNSGGSGGGGIYNDDGIVTISNSTLSGNAAYEGGAVFSNGGTVTVSGSTLSSSFGIYAIYGGGIYNSGGTVTVSYSTLSGNNAYFPDYPWIRGYGGGIYNGSGTVTISYSTLFGNTAGTGGGIYNNGGTVTVENSSSITANYASDAGADVENLTVLYLDSTSEIGILDGNPATPF